MRWICLVFYLLWSIELPAQTSVYSPKNVPSKTINLLLSGIGESLYDYEVAATSKDNSGRYEWRFILAEHGLRSKVNKEIANKLTTFVFSFDSKKGKYNGEVLRTKEGVNPAKVLAMIYRQLRQNTYLYGKNLDAAQIDGEHYYVLYFQY